MSRGLRLAVVGKGGAGKSVLTGTLARALGRSGRRVLALDSDLMPGLAFSLGAEPPPDPPLAEAAERGEDGRWRFRPGIGPARAVARFAVDAPDGVRLLQCGKSSAAGLPPASALQAFYATIHGLSRVRSLAGWDVVGDLSAGPRQTAFHWAPYAEHYLVVVEPSWKSALTARRIARIARERGVRVLVVGNRLGGPRDAGFLERVLGERLVARLPADPAVADAERLGRPVIDHAPGSRYVRAVERLARELTTLRR